MNVSSILSGLGVLMRMLENRKFLYVVLVPLTLPLLLLYIYYRGLPSLFVLIILTLFTLILPRAFSPLSFFRSLVLEIALFPAIALSVDLSGLSVSLPDLSWFFQVVITFSFLFRFIIPAFCVMIIAAYEIHEKITLKKYIPFLAIMILTFVTAAFAPALYSISFFLFHYAIVMVITDICEGCLYKHRYSLIHNLPYIFLYLTAIYRLRS